MSGTHLSISLRTSFPSACGVRSASAGRSAPSSANRLATLSCRCHVSAVLLGLNVELLHQACVGLEIAMHELRECVRAPADRLLRRLHEAFADRGFGKRLVNVGVE